MKRPRRAPKPRKPARKKPAKRLTRKQRLAKNVQEAEAAQRTIDPYHLDQAKVPVGCAYQWVPVDGMRNPVWREVPYSRHAHDFPTSYNKMGHIIFDGLVLVEALAAHAQEELKRPRDAALAMERELWEGFNPHDRARSAMGMLREEDIVTKVLPDAPPEDGPDVDVTIPLPVRVPAKWATAAAYLNLTLEEYARRRLVMQQVMLAALWDGTEPIKEYPYWPSGQIVYGPVNLHISPRQDI